MSTEVKTIFLSRRQTIFAAAMGSFMAFAISTVFVYVGVLYLSSSFYLALTFALIISSVLGFLAFRTIEKNGQKLPIDPNEEIEQFACGDIYNPFDKYYGVRQMMRDNT